MSEITPIYVREADGIVLLGGRAVTVWTHWFEDQIPKTAPCPERPNTMGVPHGKCKHCADPHFADLSGLHERVYLPAFVPAESPLPVKGQVVIGLPVEVLAEIPADNCRGMVLGVTDEHARIELIPADDGK